LTPYCFLTRTDSSAAARRSFSWRSILEPRKSS
jgi:hypothetical protein